MTRLVIFLLPSTVIQLVHTSAIQKAFYRLEDETGVSLHSTIDTSNSWLATSVVQCALKCNAETRCVGFTWDTSSTSSSSSSNSEGTCTIGSVVKKDGADRADTLKLYTLAGNCRYDLGYELRSASSDARCLYFATEDETYVEGRSRCDADGGRLLKASTQSLIDVVGDMASERGYSLYSVYIGLDDLDTEDTFIWSDGATMTSDERQLFIPSEPNNYGNVEDCGAVWLNMRQLSDLQCDGKTSYVCEMGEY